MNHLFTIITIAFFMLISVGTYAQNNLQFNQVINLKSGENYTVPNGKALKIESMSTINGTVVLPYVGCLQGCSGCYFYCTYKAAMFSLGGLVDTVTYQGSNAYNTLPQCNCAQSYTQTISSLPSIVFPIWLKAGQVVQLYTGGGLFLSGLEFNITQ